MVVAVEDSDMLPIGLGFFATTGNALPLLEDDLATIAKDLGVPLRSGVRQKVQQVAEELQAYSYETIRRTHRVQTWSTVPTSAVTPMDTASRIREEFAAPLEQLARIGSPEDSAGYAAVAATLLLQLCDAVAGESGTEKGLAWQLASLDIADLSRLTLGSSGQLYAGAHVAAIEADRTPQSFTDD